MRLFPAFHMPLQERAWRPQFHGGEICNARKLLLQQHQKKKKITPMWDINLPGGSGDCRMSTDTSQCRTLFDELKSGDRIEVEHMVTVGRRSWPSRTVGKVVRTERRHHGLHFHRNFDDAVFSDSILLELSDGELTTVSVDEFTRIHRA
jgi:hypothetical protein